MAHTIFDIGPVSKDMIFQAAYEAMEYYPNSHLGEYSRLDDLRSVFRCIRRRVSDHGQTVFQAAQDIYLDAQRYVDM